MDSLKAHQLLIKSASLYVNERQNYSREEITKKINEIKYLAAQKKVPKLTLRKEIIHLENKLGSIFELEKKILKVEKKESEKIKNYKRQINELRQRLAVSQDKDLLKKVEKLSHLLAECVSKKNIADDVVLQQKLAQEIKPIKHEVILDEQKIFLVHTLEKKLDLLKKMLIVKDGNKEKIQRLQDKVNLITIKLKELYEKFPELEKRKPKVKHTIIFEVPKIKN